MDIAPIPLANLAIISIPVLMVLIVFYRWALDVKNALYAVVRMLLQLLLIGYFLTYIFGSDNAWIIIIVLSIMLFGSGWIALDAIKALRKRLFLNALISITLGGVSILFLVTEVVLDLTPWYQPQFMIPLAGMIFANSMTCVSLCAERFFQNMNINLITGKPGKKPIRPQ